MNNARHFVAAFAVLFVFSSCSNEPYEVDSISSTSVISSNSKVDFSYNSSESETLSLINAYRKSLGLNELATYNYISAKSEEHTQYMIAKKAINHDGFTSRSEDIIKVIGAQKVGENVAYNYVTSEGVLKAWLESPTHKATIEGDYTHFGISIAIDESTGRKYYTNIFAKI